MTVITPKEREAWKQFIRSDNNFIHYQRHETEDDMDHYAGVILDASRQVADRVIRDIGAKKPAAILDVGCTNGLKCLAFRERFPEAEIVGIEPEPEAIALAEAIVRERGIEKLSFHIGVGEVLPFADRSFDLVVCHTVIEHVQDVNKVISEVARVLKPGGILHLEAPNYNWPYEPHIYVVCIPRLGKRFCAFMTTLQGKRRMTGYLEHLKFVHPQWLEKEFSKNGLRWRNVFEEKIRAVSQGSASALYYRSLGKFLRFLHFLRIDGLLAAVLLKTGIYPSVLYVVWKPE